jgi:hypothetical protein
LPKLGYLLLVPPGQMLNWKTNVQINNKCQIEKCLLEQMSVSDPLFIVPMSSPNFGNAIVVRSLFTKLLQRFITHLFHFNQFNDGVSTIIPQVSKGMWPAGRPCIVVVYLNFKVGMRLKDLYKVAKQIMKR